MDHSTILIIQGSFAIAKLPNGHGIWQNKILKKYSTYPITTYHQSVMSKHYCPVISCALVVLSYYRISWFCTGSFFCGLLATRPSKPQIRRYPPLRASNPWQAWLETCTCKKWLWGLAHKSGILLCEHVILQACPLLHMTHLTLKMATLIRHWWDFPTLCNALLAPCVGLG